MKQILLADSEAFFGTWAYLEVITRRHLAKAVVLSVTTASRATPRRERWSAHG